MMESKTAIPTDASYGGNEEPEEEDACRNIPTRGGNSAAIIRLQSTQLSVGVDTGLLVHHPSNAELVYPWLCKEPRTVGANVKSSIMTPTALYSTAVHLTPDLSGRESVTTALLRSPQNSMNNVHCGVESLPAYGAIDMHCGHSILRMNTSRTICSHGLRKSTFVKFEFDHTHHQAAHRVHTSTSSVGREPRRLTFEEKAELYRVRPDLEISPVLFSHEKIDELNRRNQRRIVFAIFGGMISIVLLLVFFSMCQHNN